MPGAAAHSSAFTLANVSSPVVQFVLLVLVLASVLSWGIIFSKGRALRRIAKENRRFLDAFWSSTSLEDVYRKSDPFRANPLASVLRSAVKEIKSLPPGRGARETGVLENLSRTLNRASSLEVADLERHVGWLATIASSTPFIGLFGTVWGIMNSFRSIGSTGSASLSVVAPGISEALIATATGLAAAIPAVVAYNHFVAQIRRVAVDLDGFSQDFMNLVQKSILVEDKE